MRRPLVLAAALAAAAGPAHADGESALSFGANWSLYSLPTEDDMDETSYAGMGLAVEYERAFAESLSWRVELTGGVFLDDSNWFGIADAGAVYRFDVLKFVPYAFAGVGVIVAGGGPLDEIAVDPALVLGGGLDFLRSRDWSWGFEGRLATFASDITTFSAGVRYTRRWGYF